MEAIGHDDARATQPNSDRKNFCLSYKCKAAKLDFSWFISFSHTYIVSFLPSEVRYGRRFDSSFGMLIAILRENQNSQ